VTAHVVSLIKFSQSVTLSQGVWVFFSYKYFSVSLTVTVIFTFELL